MRKNLQKQLLRLVLLAVMMVGGTAWAQTTVTYTGSFASSTGANNSYAANKTITLASKTWLASYSYFASNEFRLGSNNTVAVPSKFFAVGDGSSIEMQWDITNVKKVSFTNAGLYGSISNWYIFESTDSGTSWTQVTSSAYTNNSTLTYTATTPAASARYALVVLGSKPRAILTTVQIETPSITCTAPTISTQPTNASTSTPATAQFTVAASAPASPAPSLAYQWQFRTSAAGTWANVTNGTGGTSATYTTPATTAGMNGYQYQVIVTNNCSGGTATATTSNTVTLTTTVPVIGTLSTNTLDYGNIAVGSNDTKTFTVASGTGITGNITAATAAPFQVSLDNITFTNSVSFANPGAGSPTTVYVKYSPAASGAHTGNVTLNATGATQKTVTVGGTGITAIGTLSTDTLDYGNINIDSNSTQSFTVAAGTGITGNITAATTAPFQVSLDNITFTNSVSFANPGSTTTIYVKYSPTTGGTHTDAVTINATGATQKTVTVGGTGIASAALGTLSTDVMDYGYIAVGSNNTQTFTVGSGTGITGNITAEITAPFQVSLDNVTFSNSVSFANPGSGATATVYVKYSPTATGSSTATVIVNATGATEKTVTVGGTGVILPVITSATTASSTYNTANTYTITSTGTATITYSATSVPSGATFNAAAGTITFPQAFPASETPYSISITATNNYGSDTKTLVYTRNKAAQTIGTFATTDTKVYGTGSYSPSVTATSGLTVTYTSSNQAVATTNGATITVVGVGTTTITASQAGDTNWNAAADKTQTLTITAKTLTITGAVASNKVYDGTNAATISGTYVLNGVVNNEVTLSGTPAGIFASTSVANGIAVSISGFTITPASANYTLTQPAGTANITARPVTVTATAQDKNYDGTTAATINAGYTVNNTVNNDPITITGAFANANAGIGKTVTVTLGGTGVGNYTLSAQPGITATINKIAHPGFTTNAITTGITTFTIGTGNVTSLSDGTFNYSSTNTTIFTVSGNTITGVAAGTANLIVSQDAGTNYLASTTNATVPVTVASVIYPYNSFLSTAAGGAYTAAATWCKCNTVVNSPCTGTTPGQGGWSASGAASTPGATHTVFVQGPVTAATAGATNVTILSGGELTVSSTYPISNSLLVKDGGKLNINSSLFNLSNTTATFTVEDNAEVFVNANSANMATFLWRGVESFAGNSTFTFNTFYISTAPLFDPEDITDNTTTLAKFGNLVFAPTTFAGGNGQINYVIPQGTYKVTHQDFTINNASDKNFTLNTDGATVGRNFIINPTTGIISIQTQAGSKLLTVNGNVIKNGAGTFRGTTASSSGSAMTLNIDGDLIINAGTFNPHFTSASGVTSAFNLKGDLIIANGASFSNQSVNSAFNFTGTGNGLTDATTQTVDNASATNTNLVFNVKNGAYVKLANRDFLTGSGSTFTVENGGTFNTDVYKLSGVSTFNSATGSTIATANTAGIGGSVTTTGTKTFNDTTNYIFNGVTTTPFPATITKAANIITNANVTLNGAITPSGNITVNAGTLDLGTFTLNRATNGGIFTIATGAKAKVNGGSALFPSNYATKTFQANSTVTYANSGTPAITVNNLTGVNYSNVELSGTGAKTLANGLTMERDLVIKSDNPVITLAAGTTVTVKNKVDNQAGADKFVVGNNAALLQDAAATANNNVTAITVLRNSNPLFKLDYTLWGSTVVAQQLQSFSPATLSNRFYTYAYNWNAPTSNNREQYFATNAANNFTPGKAYLIRTPDAVDGDAGYANGTSTYTHIGTFNGAPNNGTVALGITVANTNTTTGGTVNQSGHYIAVANPYPSPISVNEFFAQNSSTLEAGSGIYFWRKKNDGAANSYAHLSKLAYTSNGQIGGNADTNGSFYTGGNSSTFNENWIISPAQGFLVKLKTGLDNAATVNFTNSMRKPAQTTQSFFKTANNNDEPAVSRLWLNLANSNSSAFSQAAVGYLEQGTLGLDYGYDAKMLGDGNAKLYSREA
ncbi:MAG: YDG domain-containing protein, partial [Bacteroidota bacterium]